MGIFIHTKFQLLEKVSGDPLTGDNILVKLYDKDPLEDDFLGEGHPDKNGNITIKFDLDNVSSADSPFEDKPDLYFIVYKGQKEIYRSTVLEDVDTSKEGGFDFKSGKELDLGSYLI